MVGTKSNTAAANSPFDISLGLRAAQISQLNS